MKQTNKNEQTNKQTNKRTNKQTNKRTVQLLGLGISRRNAESQWNPVYNVFWQTCGQHSSRAAEGTNKQTKANAKR